MLDFADNQALKQLYNYGLASLRQMQEMEEEVAFEFRTDKVYPDRALEKMMRALNAKVYFGSKLKQKKNKQVAQILHGAKFNP